MRSRTIIVVAVLAGAALLAPGAAEAYLVAYDYYVYATGAGGTPVSDDQILTGETATAGAFSMDGDPLAGNHATAEYLADIASGTLRARATAVGGVSGNWPFGFTATGRVETIRFEDRLTFEVPAGTYPDGVVVGTHGRIAGQLSATAAASAQLRCMVDLGVERMDTGLLSIGNDDDTTIQLDQPFALAHQIVAPGTTLNEPQTYQLYVKAYLGNARTATILEGSSPDYVTGAAEIDFLSGVQFHGVDVPPGVSWHSDSGVFLTEPNAAPEASARAARLLGAAPNPFNPRTVVAFEIAEAGPCELVIHDLRGRAVRILWRGDLAAGRHEMLFDGRDDAGRALASGVYLANLSAGGARDLRKLTLVR